MAAQKQYKNVYTILEKVKKGEIKSHYKTDDGLFGKLNFYKKPDIVKPYLHYLDGERIDNIMHQHVYDPNSFNDSFNRFAKSKTYQNIAQDKKPDFRTFHNEIRDIYRDKFPKHLSNDVFKMYYDKIEKLEFADRDEKNQTKFKFLEKSNNPVGKIMSENSQLKSSIFMKNVIGYFLTQLAILKFQDKDAFDDMMKNMNDSSDFDSGDTEQTLKDMFDNTISKNMFEKAMDDAQQTCKTLDDNLSEDQQQQIFDGAESGGEAAKIDGEYVERLGKSLQNVKLSLGSLKEKIKKLMDKSVCYFSAKEETTYDDLFNSDNLGGLDDFMLLHPGLRKIMAEDVMIKETKKVGKIDLYIDVSGSMDSGCGLTNSQGNYISKIDFCKAFAYKLKQMDMLNDIYEFENRVTKGKNDLVSIAMMYTRGGTDIDKAVNKIKTNGVNALVITDAEDRCEIYSDKAFFIGVKGANFTHFNTEIIEQYSERDQVVVFDGTSIHKVDKTGRIAK
jgi:hypothetical protein